MSINLYLPLCGKGTTMPLGNVDMAGVIRATSALPDQIVFPAGAQLLDSRGQVFFTITGHTCLSICVDDIFHTQACPLLMAERDMTASNAPIGLDLRKTGYSLAVITLSDKAAQGLRRDESGPLLAEMTANALPICFSNLFLLPDEVGLLRALVAQLALAQSYDIILTTGGTGLSPRDITPQAIRPLLDVELPGFSQAMMNASLAKTPNAAISRSIAGLVGKSLVITFPGSKKAVRENLLAILQALPHALKKIHGDPTDCGA